MRHISLIAVLVLFMFVVPTFGAMATDVVRVVLISPSGRIDDGKTAKVEVHVFDNGQYVEPSQVQAHDFSYKNIELTKKATGIWNGTVTAQEGYISANAQVAGRSTSDTLLMRVTQKTTAMPRSISITPTRDTLLTVPRPGAILDYYIGTYENGALADDYSLSVAYTQNGQGGSHSLSYTKAATGIYKTSFTVPQGNASTTYTITAQTYWTGRLIATAEVQVDFCQVWFHKQSITNTTSAFDIYVAEPTGKALSGATVYLNYSYRSTKTGWTQSKNAGQATTDPKGKANYTITYADVEETVSLSGTVGTNGNVQQFSGDIIVTPRTTQQNNDQPRQPMPFTFDVVYQGSSNDLLGPGKAAALPFKAYYGTYYPYKPTAPLANKVVNYYAHTYSQLVAHGNVTTDAVGNLTLNLNVPQIQDDVDELEVDFDCEVPTNSWSTHSESVTISKYPLDDYLSHPEKLKDSKVKVSVDKLRVGGRSKVTAEFNGATYDTQALIVWVPADVGIADMMSWSDTQPEWQQLNGGNQQYMAKSGKTFTSNIYVPEFMPQGTYTIFVGCIVPEDVSTYNMYKAYHVNYLHVKAGEGGSTGGTGILGLGTLGGIDVVVLLLLMIIIIVVVVAVVVALVRRSRRTVTYQQTKVVQAQSVQTAPSTGPVVVAQQQVVPAPVPQPNQQYTAPPPPPAAMPPSTGPPPTQ
jgi:hypothetical protein